MERLLRGAAVVLSVAFVVVYGGIALLRMRYPYEIEWMEGGVLDHVTRLLEGAAIYVRPTVDFVPFPYTPLYDQVAAAASLVLGPGFLPLRLVSFVASLGCLWIVYRLVVVETGDRVAGALALGAFAATYRLSGAWMDLARPDALFLLFFWASVYCFRTPTGWRWLAGVLAGCLAFLTKQAALPMLLPVFAWCVWRDRRRGILVLLAASALSGLAILVANVRTDGWFFYYVFFLPAHRLPQANAIVDFFRQDLLRHLGIVAAFASAAFVLPVRGADRSRIPFFASLASGAVGGSLLMRTHPGGYVNTLLPAYSALAVLFGLGFHECHALLSDAAGAAARRAKELLLLACVLQLVDLAYDPRSLIPTSADEAAGARLESVLRGIAGDVLVWSHPYLSRRVGKPGHAHELAVAYVISADPAGEGARLKSEFARAMTDRRYAALVVDDSTVMPTADWKTSYVPSRSLLEEPSVFRTRTGRITRPETLWLPRN